MATDPRRDRHHFLARHLLAHFVGGDGLLRVYDRRQGWVSRLDIPERVAREKYLYAPETASEPGADPKDDSVERWLATEIDGPAARPIADLVSGVPMRDLSEASIHAIADFLALLDLRTPAIRDLLTPVFRSAAAKEITDTKRTQKALRKRGVHVTRGEVRRIAKDKGPGIAASMAKPVWLNYLQETRTIARINVKARRWSIVEAPAGSEFVTSDLGIAKSIIGPLAPTPWEAGTALGRTHWIIPICPERAIALTPQNSPDPTSSKELVNCTNEQLARDARRYLYSRSSIDVTFFAVAPEAAGTSGTRPPAG